MLDQAFILLFIISFLDLALGLFVFLKNPNETANRSFFFLTLAVLIWINASFFEDELINPVVRFFLLKLDFASAIFASFALILFCFDISKVRTIVWTRISVMAIPTIFAILVFATGTVLSGYEIQGNTIAPIFGGTYIIYAALIALALLLGIGSLAWKYRKSSLQDKVKLIYLFIGFSLSALIAFITNIALNEYIQNSPNYRLYSRLGSFGTIFFVLFSGYSIVKHRLFNLKVIATELLSLGILVFSLFQVLKSPSIFYLAVNGIIFIVLLVFIIMLVRSVENGIKREEKLRRVSKKLTVANEKLKELDQARAEFMSFASHQLQTPLTAIRGYASLLLDGSGGELTANQKDMTEKISVSSERMVQLVEDYLNLSRIESGKLQFTFADWHLEEICKEVINTLELKAREKGLFLTLDAPNEGLPAVRIDGPKVREVISNLVDNAIKYTPNGSVTVDISRRKTDGNKDCIRVTVSDTGLGISKDEMPYLFAKFSRGNNEERLKIKGTGLGLYVGKVMIEANGGKIWAESDGVGRGSRFIVELPIEQAEPAKLAVGGGTTGSA